MQVGSRGRETGDPYYLENTGLIVFIFFCLRTLFEARSIKLQKKNRTDLKEVHYAIFALALGCPHF